MKLTSNYFIRISTAILFLIFFFQSWTKADDIRDFEIEGISIGDSLLKYMKSNEIRESILPYFEDERKYYVVLKTTDLKIFDRVELYLKNKDSNYLIKGLVAGIFPNNLDECLKEKKIIVEDIENSLNIKLEDLIEKHSFYVNTTLHSSFYYFGKDYIRVDCTYYDDKDKEIHGVGLLDNLSISAYTNEINNWFNSGYE